MADEAKVSPWLRGVVACAEHVVRSERRGSGDGYALVPRVALADLRIALTFLAADEASAMAAPQAADPSSVVADLEASTPHPIPHESPKEGK